MTYDNNNPYSYGKDTANQCFYEFISFGLWYQFFRIYIPVPGDSIKKGTTFNKVLKEFIKIVDNELKKVDLVIRSEDFKNSEDNLIELVEILQGVCTKFSGKPGTKNLVTGVAKSIESETKGTISDKNNKWRAFQNFLKSLKNIANTNDVNAEFMVRFLHDKINIKMIEIDSHFINFKEIGKDELVNFLQRFRDLNALLKEKERKR